MKKMDGSLLTGEEFSAIEIKDMRFYNTTHVSLLARYLVQIEMVFNFDKPKNVDVLDVGCGDGQMIRHWISKHFSYMKRARGINYTGVDLSSAALEKAVDVQGRAYVNRCQFIAHDITGAWTFAKDRSFDIIWYTEVIEHVPAESALHTLNECYRVLRSAGLMLLSTPAMLDGKINWPDVHDHEFTREEMEGLLAAAGFTIVDCWGTGVNWNRKKFGGNRANLAILRSLRKRVGSPLARVVMQALMPEMCTNLAWIVRK